MKIAEIMSTDFPILQPHLSIDVALRKFLKYHLNLLPIVNQNGSLVGIVTRNRLLRALLDNNSIKSPVKSIMVKKIISLLPDHDLEVARRILEENSISQAPILDDNHQVIGILSTAQIIDAYKHIEKDANAQLELLFRNLNFGLLSLDKYNRITAFNSLAQIICGDAIAIGNELSSPSELLNLIETAKKKSAPIKHQCKINNHSLLIQCFQLTEKGAFSGIMVTMDDLSNFEQTVEELRITKKWQESLRLVFDLAYDGLVLINENGEIIMVNTGFCKLTDLNQEDLIGATIAEIPELGLSEALNHSVPTLGMAKIINSHHCLISTYPVKDNNRIIGAVAKVIFQGLTQLHQALEKMDSLEKQISYYEAEFSELKGTKYSFSDIIGDSEYIRSAKAEALAASQSTSTVLLLGESGTGKELFAHGIHAASKLNGSFVKVNCSAIPENLLEAEFFGY